MTNKEAINLISRNKSVFQYDTEMTKALNLAIKALEERPQGKWIKFEAGHCTNFFKCSLCGRIINTIKEKPCDYPFCHCGADMRKEANDE